ncbi:mycothiol conjugate amidase Mca [Planobispora rosea]|uniref:mycothiol conjugate amidase Mca n=1 Tax=Planobispora rosea TaxID=35762 RepID=UPI00083B9C25|nr:mycothiol conjugate amidase Mca [Planobispora rosea]
MAVHAHPDDESSKGAATLARYAAEGVDVLVCTCTGGERGDVLNPAMDRPGVLENMAEIRRAEMAEAAAILGVGHRWLGFVDSGLPGEGEPLPEGCFAVQDLEVAAAPLVAAVREFRPHVILTYDETGGYPHPDHIMTHRVSVEAFEAAGDPGRYPGAGEPWQPLKLYYMVSFSREWFSAIHEGLLARGLESPLADVITEDWFEGMPELTTTTRITCDDYFETRDRAIKAHATQIDPEGPWFATPRDLEREIWPTEDYQLARSHVETELPETDLFAGLREPRELPELPELRELRA